jgi:O-antigen ligase
MSSIRPSSIQIIFVAALSLLLPLWNIPDTITVRYFASLFLLVIVIFCKPDWKTFFKHNQFLLIFFVYILIQLIFFSTDYKVAFYNFKSEWLKFILFAFAGVGCGYYLKNKQLPKLNLYLGLLFAIPLFIHLASSLIKGIELGTLPISYWGINKTHGDLAYTSLHTTIFICTFLLLQAKSRLEKWSSVLLLFVCFLSLLIASSRGGMLFLFISVATVILICFFIHQGSRISYKKFTLSLVFLGVFMFGVFQIGVHLDPIRWGNTLAKLEMGFKGDAIKIDCEGVGVLKEQLENDGVQITPEISVILNSIEMGDGERVMAARSAVHLIPNHLMGINQSRSGYAIALAQECGHEPKSGTMHSHNGWLDTALAIGIAGAILYFLVCCNFMRRGLQAAFHSSKEIAPYGVALLSLGFIWILRACFDSTQRDQMLEMQIFTMCLISAYILFYKEEELSTAG